MRDHLIRRQLSCLETEAPYVKQRSTGYIHNPFGLFVDLITQVIRIYKKFIRLYVLACIEPAQL